MKIIYASVAVLAGLSLTACGQASTDTAAVSDASVQTIEYAETTRLAIVDITADWCAKCKALAPKLDAVKAANAFPGAEFVVLDYTDKNKSAFFAAADAAGVGEPVREKFKHGVKTGQLLLVDLDDQKIIGIVGAKMTENEIKSAIETATAAA